jgi:hypothetical protein
VLDHVFTDAIGALREAFDKAFLERQAFEEHLQSDVLLGDLVWTTSYGLPGEGQPPRVVAHVTFTWPSWSQATYRAWYVEETFHESPVIELEVVFRVQRLVAAPDTALIAAAVSATSPSLGGDALVRDSVTIEQVTASDSRQPTQHGAELAYHGVYALAEATLADGTNSLLDEHFGALGGWVASTLVKLGDLSLVYHPTQEGAE